MCIALEYLNQLSEIHNQMLADYEVLKRKQIEVERKLNNKYHEIEKNKFNAVQGYVLNSYSESQIIAHCLYELSWGGFTPEDQLENIESFKKSIEDFDE